MFFGTNAYRLLNQQTFSLLLEGERNEIHTLAEHIVQFVSHE